MSAASCGRSASIASSKPPGIVAAAQARLPRPGRGVKHGGDAVAIACRSLSISATSIGKSTPGRGIICRSNASPCRSTMPGQHQQAAGIDAERAAALVGADARRCRGRRSAARFRQISSPSRARPPSMKMSVTMRHSCCLVAAGREPRVGLIFVEKILDRRACGNRAGRGAASRGPSPTTRARASRSGDGFRKPPLDRPRRIAGDDGVGRARPWSRSRRPRSRRRCRCCGPAARSRHARSRRHGRYGRGAARRQAKNSASSLSPGK